jgi:hypothetical protein
MAPTSADRAWRAEYRLIRERGRSIALLLDQLGVNTSAAPRRRTPAVVRGSGPEPTTPRSRSELPGDGRPIRRSFSSATIKIR